MFKLNTYLHSNIIIYNLDWKEKGAWAFAWIIFLPITHTTSNINIKVGSCYVFTFYLYRNF